MTRAEICHQRLGEWLTGLEMPGLGEPTRRLEEGALSMLRNFLVLLLASGSEPATSPLQALETAGGLARLDLYRQHLTLPLSGTPESVTSAIELGRPSGELFALQSRLLDELDDDGRAIILRLGKLF